MIAVPPTGWPTVDAVFSPGTDEAYIRDVIAQSADGSNFLFLNGQHDLLGPIELHGSDKSIFGQSKQAIINNKAGIAINISGSGHYVHDLRIQSEFEINPGSLIRVNSFVGLSQTTFERCEFFQNRQGSPIFDNVLGEVTEVRFRDCYGRHHLDATVPSWHFMDSVAGTGSERKVTLVLFDGYRHLYSGDYAFKIESVDSSTTGPNCVTLRNVNFERCPGGLVHAVGCRCLLLEQAWVGDFDPAVKKIHKHLIRLEGTTDEHTQFSTGRICGITMGESDDSYEAGIKDISIGSSAPDKAAPVILENLQTQPSKGKKIRANFNGCVGIEETNCMIFDREGYEHVVRSGMGKLAIGAF